MTVWAQKPNSRQPGSARRPVIDSHQQKVPFASGDGLRWSAGRTMLILVAAVLVLILVSDLAVIGSGAQSISSLSSRIGRLEDSNLRIRNRIEQSIDLAAINAASIKRDLVSSQGVPIISLTAPDNLR